VPFMLRVANYTIYAEYRYTECHYVDCRYAE
jgi:hypothetical protein